MMQERPLPGPGSHAEALSGQERGGGRGEAQRDAEGHERGGVVTLVEFLLARIAEDEAAARETGGGPWRFEPGSALLRRFSPPRVLAECQAKRVVITQHAIASDAEYGHIAASIRAGRDFEFVMRWWACAHADHPDYREEWRP